MEGGRRGRGREARGCPRDHRHPRHHHRHTCHHYKHCVITAAQPTSAAHRASLSIRASLSNRAWPTMPSMGCTPPTPRRDHVRSGTDWRAGAALIAAAIHAAPHLAIATTGKGRDGGRWYGGRCRVGQSQKCRSWAEMWQGAAWRRGAARAARPAGRVAHRQVVDRAADWAAHRSCGGGGARRVVRWVRVERVLTWRSRVGCSACGGVALEGIQGVEGLEHGGARVAEFGGAGWAARNGHSCRRLGRGRAAGRGAARCR